MADFNKVILLGRLTRDIELRYTASGSAVADFGLAVNRVSAGRDDGEKKKEVLFVDVTVWNKLAENCSKYISKGSEVLVEGRLKLNQWDVDGQKRSKIEVVGVNIQFLRGTGSQESDDTHQ